MSVFVHVEGGGRGQKMAKFCPRSCWMPPNKNIGERESNFDDKYVEKSIQLVRGSSFRNDLLQNPYFNFYTKHDDNFFSHPAKNQSKIEDPWMTDQSLSQAKIVDTCKKLDRNLIWAFIIFKNFYNCVAKIMLQTKFRINICKLN